ncbi:rasGAP-activating-like protein 1 isoform X1 [Alligator mississippiensis]|uniref:RasGAP-activating-like protein 1 isoform B n=1 Tax=Alligator mississippiensis TaxID=8496 RepID=A0A151N4R2_ALLMI|nr:rasGAP-activating-like protein 1 isoform X1 [Alligator mississippiensis]KYO31782.1 rasGAP-activating-like protein 1 isoform B [Alligator mississippiensis]
MARNTALHFRVVEGRHLPAKDVSGSSDPYCIVKVDNEVVARTATVWKNLNPFWGEEYTLHLPLGFHGLTFYVLDEDTIGHDDVIGKISLSKEQISSHPRGIDSWINLTRVDPNEEVQGEIHLELWVLEEPHRRVLHCHVIEARDLAPRDISGTSDPFARVSCNGQTLETAIIKKTRFPHWDEVLEFDLEERELEKETRGPLLSMEVWDWDMVGKNDFLGQVEFSLDTLQKSPVKGWFRLLPFPNAEEDAGGKLGALRLKVQLAEDRILPSMYYQPLIELLVESILCPAEEEHVTPLAILEEISSVESRQDVAMKLVKIFLGQGLAVPFLDYLNLREVTRTTDPNTLFRSNSLASKSMEQFMKVVGMPYLHEVLKPIINRIFEEKKYVELDPCKIEMNRTRRISFKGSLSEAQVRESSLELLKGYLSDIMESIIGSVEKCPPIMRVAFKHLHKQVEDQFPEAEHEDVKYIAISGFLFLRFFAPAILTPKLFNLRDQHADPRTSRTLLLLAKAVQSIGNLGLQLGHGKEQWMAPLHPFIIPCVSHVKDFLDKLIDVDSENAGEAQPRTLFHPSATIKEGYLHKRKAEGLHLVTRFTFKKRYFWLSSETLSYSKSPEWQVRSSIPIQRICAVERVDENAFQQPHMMQIITQDGEGQLHTMYIQCKNVNELNQWLSAVRKASIYNERMLPSCHPGAFRGSRWTCCLQADRTVHGCSRTHSAVTLGDWSDPLDPDAEAQMVYGQLLLARDKLREKYLELSEARLALEQEEGQEGSYTKEDHERSFQDRRMAATARLLDVIQDLERAHSAFERREKEEAATESY